MSKALPAWFLLITIVLLFACNEDEPTNIGSGLLETLDNPDIQFTDSLDIDAKLVRIDSVNSGQFFNVNVRRPYLLGAIDDDPVFGSSFAGVYVQLTPFDNIAFKSEDLVFDSLYLFLDYVNLEAYGDSTSRQNWVVYEMAEKMDSMRSYSHENFLINEEQELGRATDFKIETIEPFITTTDDTLDSQIRIDLTESDLGERFVAVLRDSLDSTFVYNDQFKELLNGIYIAPDTTLSNNSLATIDVLSNTTSMRLHYSDMTIEEEENRGQTLSFIAGNDTCHVLNHFHHNYGAAQDPVISQILGTQEKELIEEVYLQGHAGLQAELSFPTFGDLGSIIVNKAELVLTHIRNDDNEDSTYVPPINFDFRSPILSRYSLSEDDELSFIEDYLINPVTTIVEKDTLDTQVTTYTLSLNLFFQEMVDALPEERKLIVSVSNQAGFNERLAILADDYMMERVVLTGPDYPDDELRMKVNLHYTQLTP